MFPVLSLIHIYIAVLVIPRNVLREAVRIRADTCSLSIGSVQYSVKTVVSEFVTAVCTFVPGLPSHAADAAVVLRSKMCIRDSAGIVHLNPGDAGGRVFH